MTWPNLQATSRLKPTTRKKGLNPLEERIQTTLAATRTKTIDFCEWITRLALKGDGGNFATGLPPLAAKVE